MQRQVLVNVRGRTAGSRPWHARADAEDLRSFLTISRMHPSDIGERQIVFRLDGGRPVNLYFGESQTMEIRPGYHRVRVHNTLIWRNLELAIEPGEHLEILTINSGRWWTYGMAGVLGAAPLFLRVEVRSKV